MNAARKTTLMPLLLTAACLILAACGQAEKTTVLKGQTMGTYWQVSIAKDLSENEQQKLVSAIEADLHQVNQQMSTYIPDSELMQFNRNLAVNTPIAISPELRKVIKEALIISRQSDGFYDVTIGPLVDLWGFGPKKVTAAPAAEAIEAAKARVGYQQLSLTDAGLAKSRADISVDLSSIAKGYGVDVVAEKVKSLGYPNYLVDIGGELRAGGDKFGKPWQIGVEVPETQKQEVQTVLALQDRNIALATSGNYRNYADYGSVRAVHTINPKTGYSEQSKLLSVTVIASDCMTADGYATALMAMGDKRASDFANAQHLAVLFIYAGSEAGQFRIEKSAAWQQEFGGKP